MKTQCLVSHKPPSGSLKKQCIVLVECVSPMDIQCFHPIDNKSFKLSNRQIVILFNFERIAKKILFLAFCINKLV